MFFLVLAILFLWLPGISWIKSSGIKSTELRLLLLVQITAGLIVGWYTSQYHLDKDYWSLHREGLLEYQLLKKDPIEFIKSITFSPYENQYGHFFNAVGSYWNDLRNTLMAKLLAIINLISNGNYYTNSLFFNTLAFIGHVFIYKLFILLYPANKKILIFSCFLLPSTLLFVSGIHKDILIFSALSVFCYFLYVTLQDKLSVKRLILLVLTWMILLVMRNFLAIVLLFFVGVYIISEKTKRNGWLIFTVGSLLMITFVFLIDTWKPEFSPAKLIANRQADFAQLETSSASLPLQQVQPNAKSLTLQIPEAANHGWLRPYPFETPNLFTKIMGIEWWIYLVFVLLSMITSRNKLIKARPMLIFLCSFPLFMMLVSGWIVPNLNAIVRYRSIYLPLLLTPFIVLTIQRIKHINL